MDGGRGEDKGEEERAERERGEREEEERARERERPHLPQSKAPRMRPRRKAGASSSMLIDGNAEGGGSNARRASVS